MEVIVKAEKIQAARDPQREHLAACIADRGERARAVEQAKAAVERATLMVEAAEARDAIAKASLASWRSDQVARVMTTASTGAALTPQISARESRLEAQDAEDALSAANAASAACKARLSDCEADLEHVERIVAGAADRCLVVGAADRLIAGVGDLRQRLNAKYAALLWLETLAPIGTPERQKIAAATPGPPPPGVRPPLYPEPVAWIQARSALRVDPDAVLPM
jgi:hypothetical protein